ncbi:MAG: cytochrome c biogenesis protein [Ignavibacteria bacterium]|jgi:ABC-type transport system involved in cytochrome c biogenesis permease subunit|nr:cytochrome c biogenesis protein [Ignavibacteria bacterium]MDH7528237.1 cytochrome c biogenesis protein CcsA [Ignavibacteria bacterium]
MINLIHSLNSLLPLFYGITFLLYLLNFFYEKRGLSLWKRLSLFITLFFHFFYLLIRTIEFKHTPITTVFEIMTLLAFAITISYYIIELVTDVRNTGTFILFLPLIFQTISSFNIKDLLEVKDILRSPYLGIHVFTALSGYAGITFSAIYGLLYLLLYKQIKTQKFGLIFNRMPSLEMLEYLSMVSALVSFIMLTIAIVIGFIWLPQAFTEPSYFDPKLVATIIVWLFYASGISGKWFFRWSGRKIVYLSITGFVISLFSMSILNLVFTGFHKFF